MSVLVTGSSGFLGQRVVQSLFEGGASPVAFDVAPCPASGLPVGVPFVRGTIVNVEEIAAAIVEHEVSCIVTLAYVQSALGEPDFHDWTGASRVNILGVTNVFEAARLTGIDRVIFASSVGVYGPLSFYGERAITEDDPLAPGGLYGKMKQVNEEIAREYAKKYDLQSIIVRPVALLGGGSTLWPARLIEDPAVGLTSHLRQRSTYRTNAIAVDDVADLFSRLATEAIVRHDCYLASGHVMTWGEVAEIVTRHVPEAVISFDEDAPIKRTSTHLCDNTRAVNEFGWRIQSTEDAVLKTINDARRSAGLTLVS